jgi:DNA polymerase-4
MSDPRTILHVDLDAFFAAVEQRDDPSLRGKPVLVGGSSRRGVVAACSYEARAYGVRSAMPMAIALRLCPTAVVVRHDMQRYAEASMTFMQILGDFSPEVEALSFDEAFLDVTGARRLLGDGLTIARQIKARVASELRLVASVGVAPIKFAAKIASDIDKPDGLRVVTAEGLLAFLHPLPVGRLWGVGEVTRESLTRVGIHTIGELARYPREALRARLGPGLAEHLGELAAGRDPRPVRADDEAQSIGHQETLDDDAVEPDELELLLLDQADRVAARLRAAHRRATVVVLIIKYDDFRQITRRVTLPAPTSDAQVLAHAVWALLREVRIGPAPGERVRLVGLSATGLEDRDAPRQLAFDEQRRARGERLGDLADEIHAKFGGKALVRAAGLSKGPRGKRGPDDA